MLDQTRLEDSDVDEIVFTKQRQNSEAVKTGSSEGKTKVKAETRGQDKADIVMLYVDAY